MMKNKKWYCPHCSQTSSRHWNLKKHIERKHQGRGQPIREDGWHSISTNISSAAHFIPNMMSLQNDNIIIRIRNINGLFLLHHHIPKKKTHLKKEIY
jgi:hypothetical protein